MNGKFCEWDTREHCHRGCQSCWCLDKVLSAKPGYAGRVGGRKEAREAGTEKLTEGFGERCWSESKSWNHSSPSKGQWDSREGKLLSLGSDQSKNQAHIHHGFTWLCGPGTSPPFLACATPVPPTPTHSHRGQMSPPSAERSFVFFFFWDPLSLFVCLFVFNLFMAVLGLCFCARAFSSCGKWGPLFIAVRGPLTVAASLVAEHKLQTRRLSNCGSRA